MRNTKRSRLEAAGWRVGDASEFLGLSPKEKAFLELKMALSRHLSNVRIQHGWTQEEVARKLGSSQSRVAKMESADSSVSLDLLVKALLALDVSPGEVAAVIAQAA